MSMPVKKLYLIFAGLLFLGYSWLGFNIINATSSNSFTLCPIKNITGYACPSCGTTRSIMAIFEGEFYEAFLINPLGFFAIIVLLSGPIWVLLDMTRKKASLSSFYRNAEQRIKTKPLFILFTLAIAANWVWNIYKGV